MRPVHCAVALLVLAGCVQRPAEAPTRRPAQAAVALAPIKTDRRVVLSDPIPIAGKPVAPPQMPAPPDNARRSIPLADPSHGLDREIARTKARSVQGVRSVAWLDSENLFAIVRDNASRTEVTIDAVCLALDPIGDTRGVIVSLQSGAARTGDELEVLSRNCRPAAGDQASLQYRRQGDVIDPEIRAQYRANKQWEKQRRDRSREQAESMRVLKNGTPEM